MQDENTIPEPDGEGVIQDSEAVVEDSFPEPDSEDAVQDPDAINQEDK
jgi:hypothetical protein